jgi:molecular chaperone GrpE
MTHDKHKEHEKDQKKKEEETQPQAGMNPPADGSAEASEAVAEAQEEETVTIPLKEYAEMMSKVDECKKQVDEYADGWQRERADYANYRRIVERDQQETRQNILADTVKRYLVINDDIERALKKAPDDPQVAPWVDGIRLIYQKLQGILDAEGVKRIPAEEEHFDPNRHEAIMSEENSEVESGRIIEIIEQGYTIGDRVIRPARVKVAK